MTPPRSLMLDASNLVCQFYIRHRGREEAVTRDLIRSVRRYHAQFQPDHVLAALDHDDNFRREIHPAYKRRRKAKPPGLAQLLLRSGELMLRAGALPVIAPGFEADDVLATLAAHAPGPAVIVSADTDLNSIVSSTVLLRGPVTHTTVTERDVIERYGLKAREIPLFKALIGDKSDNFSGVKGLTISESQQLARRYDTMHDLLNHLADLPADTARKLIRASPAHLMRNERLTRLVQDAPVEPYAPT